MAALVLSGGLIIGASVLVSRDIGLIQSAWDEFEESRSIRTQVVTSFRSEIGYGGMIHQFKNLVLRRDLSQVEIVKTRLEGTLGILAQYTTLGMTEGEKNAVADIRRVLHAYGEALETTVRLAERGEGARDIDQIVRVDDAPAFKGLATLDREIGKRQGAGAKKITKPKALTAVRGALGYGGMIHHFKNFVLRQDKPRIAKVEEKLAKALTALEHYLSLGVNIAEEQAIEDIRKMLIAYGLAIKTAARLAEEGRAVEEIDRAVKVDDGLALGALARLDREITTQSELKSRKISKRLGFFSSLVSASTWVTGGLILLLITASMWLVRNRIITPIGQLTEVMTRLATGDNTVDLDQDANKEDKIGEMAKAVQVFKVTAIARQRAEALLKNESKLIQLHQKIAAFANEASSAEETIQQAIDEICNFTGWPFGHAFYPDPNDPETLVPAPVFRLDDPTGRFNAFRDASEKITFKSGVGMPGLILETKQPQWVSSDTRDLNFPRAKLANSLGLMSAFGVPVLSGPDVVAVLEFFTTESVEPDQFFLQSLTNICTQVGRVIERERAAEQLHASRNEADKANRAKSDFLSSMSHELRTPMNAILGFAQLLEHNPAQPLEKSQAESVKQILSGGEHLLALIDDVLNLAQIESGNFSMSIEATDSKEIVDDCLVIAKILAKNREIEILDLRTDTFLPPINIDATRFRQVLLNLLSNAVKYNHKGGSVTLTSEELVTGTLRFSIADTGPGIPEEKQNELFQPFSRLGLEATEIQGTGIGLTITKQIVELMGGSIGFESIFGKGTTFWIDLPVAEGVAVKNKMEFFPVRKKAAGTNKMTMLYIEDNPANLKLMETLIGRMDNLHMLSTHTGELGLELAAAHRPDVILMDINLPGIDGIQALHRLKESVETQDIPVIALTAKAMPSEIEAGLKAGFYDYLTKPIRIDEVTTALENALKAA
ncbi:MAG: response regulator [Rhodospirillales bacterium]|nr:response regulator [Rhodospirillales bacterium]